MRKIIFLIFLCIIFTADLFGESVLEGVEPTRDAAAHSKSAAAAYTLSVLFPGGGHLYLKNYDYFSRYAALELTTPALGYFVYTSMMEHLSNWQDAKTSAEKKKELNWVTFYGITLYSVALIWAGSKFDELRRIKDSLNYADKFEVFIDKRAIKVCYRLEL